MRYIKIFFAAITIIPFCLLGFPAMLLAEIKWISGNIESWKAKQEYVIHHWLMQPFLWSHCTLFCKGDKRLQKW